MTSENVKVLVRYRLEQAEESLQAASIPKEFSRWLHAAFDLRQRSDYGPGQVVSGEEATTGLDNAKLIVGSISKKLQEI